MSDFGESGFTRRRFLEAVGRAGGAAAVYETMVALGMLRTPDAFAGPPDLPPDHGAGQSVAILGAGIAGLTAAYELNKAGYTVTVFEAKGIAGGRSITLRTGGVVEEYSVEDPNTIITQTCKFDDDPRYYLNAGPGRLPYHHTAILHYCTLLGVDLEVYTMMSRVNLMQVDKAFASDPQANRRIANDTRGWIAELLTKAVGKGALNEELKKVDKTKLLDLLHMFGDLTKAGTYRGSSRSGYRVEPGVDNCGELLDPLELSELVSSGFWNHRFYQCEEYEWQPTLFQPVGGMDHIWRAFIDKTPVGKLVTYNTEIIGVHNIEEQGQKKVRITHRPSRTRGAGEAKVFDWCISTVPLPIVKTFDNNFDDDYMAAVRAANFADTCKVGWQTNDRFWETQDQMYGGISYTTNPITQMWYPSWDYFGKKGVLTGAYNYGNDAKELARMKPRARLEEAMKGALVLHPDFDKHVDIDLGISIAWKQVPYQLGGWVDDWACGVESYTRLLKPEGRFWVAGDQVSYLSGWQEGAVLSAHHVIRGIAGIEARVAATPMLKAKPALRPPERRDRKRGLP